VEAGGHGLEERAHLVVAGELGPVHIRGAELRGAGPVVEDLVDEEFVLLVDGAVCAACLKQVRGSWKSGGRAGIPEWSWAWRLETAATIPPPETCNLGELEPRMNRRE
jgi:hypothetical protein